MGSDRRGVIVQTNEAAIKLLSYSELVHDLLERGKEEVLSLALPLQHFQELVEAFFEDLRNDFSWFDFVILSHSFIKAQIGVHYLVNERTVGGHTSLIIQEAEAISGPPEGGPQLLLVNPEFVERNQGQRRAQLVHEGHIHVDELPLSFLPLLNSVLDHGDVLHFSVIPEKLLRVQLRQNFLEFLWQPYNIQEVFLHYSRVG